MKLWILLFSAALFAGGTCLGVALQPKLAPAPKVEPAKTAAPEPVWSHHGRELSPTRFASELKLSDEQDQQLEVILSDTQEEVQTLGRMMRDVQDGSRKRILEILTPEQKQRFDELLANERRKRGEAEVDRSVATYRKLLKLSDEQATGFRAALLEGRARRHEAYFRPRKEGEPIDFRQGMKSAREAQNKKIQEVLSPEQYAQYQSLSELERSER